MVPYTVNFVQIDPKSYCIPSIKKVNRQITELGHLKVVKLEGFTEQEESESPDHFAQVEDDIDKLCPKHAHMGL